MKTLLMKTLTTYESQCGVFWCRKAVFREGGSVHEALHDDQIAAAKETRIYIVYKTLKTTWFLPRTEFVMLSTLFLHSFFFY